MNHLAKIAVNNVLALQGQDCRFVRALGEPELGRCIARPSLDQSAGGSVRATKYDISVHPDDRLRSGDSVELFDENGQVETTVNITQLSDVLEPLRVYVGQII